MVWSALLSEEIEKFDWEIGEAVTTLCKDPRKLSEANARLLIETHSEVLSWAYHGTTLTVALINNTQEDLWVANVGDSTVGESADCHFASFRLIVSVQCKHYPVRTPMVPKAGKDYWNCTLQPHLPNISGYQWAILLLRAIFFCVINCSEHWAWCEVCTDFPFTIVIHTFWSTRSYWRLLAQASQLILSSTFLIIANHSLWSLHSWYNQAQQDTTIPHC